MSLKDTKFNHIYYFAKCKTHNNYNFGDFITPYIYKKIYNRDAINDETGTNKHVIGAGSVLYRSNANSVIWGTGFMFGRENIKHPHEILSVRGKLTRRRLLELDIMCPEVYGDIGLILPHFYNPKIEKKYKLGIIPHYIDTDKFDKIGYTKEDTIVIDVTDPIEKVIDNILSCEYTISSSLHGIITSHAYNIKCMWMRVTDQIGGGNFKFRDYYSSILETGWQSIRPYMYRAPIPVDQMIELINNYINPVLPIDTKYILDLCPFS